MEVRFNAPPANIQVPQMFNPTDQSSTNSATPVQLGLGSAASGKVVFTPVKTGNYLLVMHFVYDTQGTLATQTIQGSFGTTTAGSGPANGAAPTGTTVGNLLTFKGSANNVFAIGAYVVLLSQLSIGTQYWFDLQFSSSGLHQGAINSVEVVLMEVG